MNRLNSLGFMNVINENKDFYERIRNNELPEFDVLVTNPPYSATHMEKLIDFCCKLSKPWFLLLPNYVYTKPYYNKFLEVISTKPTTSIPSDISNEKSQMIKFYALGEINYKCHPFYIIPNQNRYLYTTPKGRRQKKSSKFTSPFPTFWYCNLTFDNHHPEAR